MKSVIKINKISDNQYCLIFDFNAIDSDKDGHTWQG